MCDCLRQMVAFWLHVCNTFVAIAGLILLGYASFMQSKHTSSLSIVLIVLGASLFFDAVVGILGVRNDSRKLLTIYGFLMALLTIATAVILILTFCSFSALIEEVKNDKAKDWLKDHKDSLQIILIVLVSVEFVSCGFGLLYRKENEATYVQRLMDDDTGRGSLSLQFDKKDTISVDRETSKHAQKRDAIGEKYGIHRASNDEY